jgi:prefoldin subunit 5
MGKRNDVEKLQLKLRQIQKKIEAIQASCQHTNTTIGFNQTSSSSVSIMTKCVDCQKFIGYPSERDRNEFLKS